MRKEEWKDQLVPVDFPTCRGREYDRGYGHEAQSCPPWRLKKDVDAAEDHVVAHISQMLLEDLEVAVTWVA